MIIFYTRGCEGCAGNQALGKMKQYCKQEGVDFVERRTIFFYVFENEANEIMKKSGVKLPFFYGTKSGKVLVGNTFTPLEQIEELIRAEKAAEV